MTVTVRAEIASAFRIADSRRLRPRLNREFLNVSANTPADPLMRGGRSRSDHPAVDGLVKANSWE